MSITSKVEVKQPSAQPKLLSYEEMIHTKGIFKPDATDATGWYIVNFHGLGNREDSNSRPLFINLRSSEVQTLSPHNWKNHKFIQVEEEITITFKGKVP